MNPIQNSIENSADTGLLRLAERTKNMGHRSGAAFGRVLSRRTNADPQPGERLGPEMLNGAAQTVVPAGTALGPQPQTTQRKIHVVHQHQQLVRLQAEPIESRTNGTTAVIHVGLRHQQAQPLLTNP